MNPVLPKAVIDIVDSYLAFSDAVEVLTLGTDGKPLDSETNNTIIEAIKLALSSPSCDREIIRLIFKNASDKGYTKRVAKVIFDLYMQDKPIFLDNVDFSGLILKEMFFRTASIKNANFTGANLHWADFAGADLSGATGLSKASGSIMVTFNTKLADTGFPFDSEHLYSLVTSAPFFIPLDASKPSCYYPIKSCGTTVWIK